MAGKRYPDELKLKIADLLSQGFRASVLAREYNISEGTLKHFPKEMARRAEEKNQLRAAINSLPVLSPSPKKDGVFSEPSVNHSSHKSFRIAVIPDCQVKPGVDISYLSKLGKYIADKRPDVVVNIGDFADMPSLSSHDAPGAKSVEGRRYHLDIEAVQEAMLLLMTPIREEIARGWQPRLIMTMGNHEHRITHAIENNPKLHGTIQLDDLRYEDWGWEVHPFLKPVVVEGVAFCHYFQTGQMGRPASSARAILNKQHMSCFAGHQQGRDIAYGKRGDGREMTAIICGSCYLHDEDYLSHQTNNHFRGMYMLNDVVDGQFQEMPISLSYIMRRP